MTIALEHLSYSSISAYLDCGEYWRRKYIAKEPTVATPALAFGSAFHGTIERLIKQENLENLTAIYDEEWKAALERGPVDWGMKLPEQTFNDGLRMLTNKNVQAAILSIRAGKDDNGHMIERQVVLKVPGVPIPIIGYIDIILDDWTPGDFKTSASSWTDDKASGSMQTLFYLAAMNQMGQPVNWKFKHIVFVKTKEPKVQVIEHEHKPGELFFLFELIERVWTGIERGVFPMNPASWKCNPNYCDFYKVCRGKY